MIEKQWIYFVSDKEIYPLVTRIMNKKTEKWEVRAKRGDYLLGIVVWRGAWRKYCFEPNLDTVFEKDCLRDLADFLEEKTKQFYANKKEFYNTGRAV